jgi:hypothetical protein
MAEPVVQRIRSEPCRSRGAGFVFILVELLGPGLINSSLLQSSHAREADVFALVILRLTTSEEQALKPYRHHEIRGLVALHERLIPRTRTGTLNVAILRNCQLVTNSSETIRV